MRHHSKYKLFRLLITGSILSCSIHLAAQDDLRFEHFTSENGLSENFVYTVYQDKKGFLWIGTHDGLNRYDGYGFKKFRHDPADSNSLPDNTIYSICEDGQGNIWMGTNAGLCKYNPSTGIFNTITLNKKLKGVEQVIPVNEQELMLRHERRLSLINNRTQQEISLTYKDSSGLHSIPFSGSPVTKDQQGNIYIVKQGWGDTRILKYDPHNKWFTELITLAVPEKFAKQNRGYFYIDSRNHCWLPLGDLELHIFNLSSSIIKKDRPFQPVRILTTHDIKHIFEDNEGNTWIASNSGLIYHDRASDKTHWYKQDNKITTSISSDDVQHIFQDRTGILWIATSNGLNKLNPLQRKFRHLTRAQNSDNGLYNNFVLGVFPEGNQQLRIHYNISKNLHFTRYHIRNKSFKHIAYAGYEPAAMIREVLVQNPERLTNELLRKVIATLEKTGGRSWMDKLGVKIWIDDQQQLWYDPGNFNSNPYWLFDTVVVDMQLYGKDLWIASSKGLIQFNTLTKTTVVYNAGGSGSNNISSNNITCFVFEEDGNMWIGTKGGGLNYFDRQKKIFNHFTQKDGLCNNSIYCMVKDDRGNIWMGTSNGMSCFDPVTREFRNYFRSDGLVNDEYNRYSACKLADGTLYMGGMNGIDYFHPDSLTGNKNIPRVQVTDFKVFNKNIEPGKNLSLKHKENFITLEFAAMDFSNPSGNKFTYWLEGVDPDWVLLENRNFTTYSYLKPGRYRFLVKGANSDGVWNDEPAVYHFTILPPWYQTWWFRMLTGLFVVACIVAAIRFYTNRKLEKQRVQLEKQKAIELERMRISTELHDDMGGELSAIRLLSEMNISSISPQQQLSKISSSSGDLVQKMNEIVWALNVNNDTLQSLIAYMRRYAVKYLDDVGIECTFQQPLSIPGKEIDGAVRRNIFLLVKETLNNVVKHAGATAVNITITVKDSLQITIQDNGRGIPDEMINNGTGNGLRNMQQRIKELKGILEIKNHKGTTLNFNLPL
jgi:signal transduction histidine kinase/ligand-binding sensor domain-containing protein